MDDITIQNKVEIWGKAQRALSPIGGQFRRLTFPS